MKCMASRIGTVEDDTHDIGDIVFLVRYLKLKTPDDVMKILAAYYPEDKIPVKAQYLIEGLFEEGKI